MTSAVRYANKLTHLFVMSCHECMMHKYKKQTWCLSILVKFSVYYDYLESF